MMLERSTVLVLTTIASDYSNVAHVGVLRLARCVDAKFGKSTQFDAVVHLYASGLLPQLAVGVSHVPTSD